MDEYYTVASDRLDAITAAAAMPESTVREYLLADWPEGREHQEWIDHAPIHEIVAWLQTLVDAR